MALAESNRILTESNVSQQKQIVAYEEKIAEVCKHNDECREESKKSFDEVEQLKLQNEKLEKENDRIHLSLESAKQETEQARDRFRRASEEFGSKMFMSGELRKPKKKLSICLQEIAKDANVDDISSMTIQEAKRLGVHLTNVIDLSN